MPSYDRLIRSLIQRRDAGTLAADMDPSAKLPKPLLKTKIDRVTNIIGQPLPGLLTRIYTEVANGGFGDSYGLLGLIGGPRNEAGFDAITLYKEYRKPDPDDDHWRWPTELLPIGHLGCAMYHCIDCSTKTGKIVLFEPNPHRDGEPWDDAFFPFCKSLNQLLTVWLDGGDVWELAESGGKI